MGDNKKIIAFLRTKPDGSTLSEIAEKTGHGRATVGKYLELMKSQGAADFTDVGMAKVWFLVQEKKPVVMIVDDEPGLVRLLKLSLGNDDYEIIDASNGIAALQKVNDFMPDLIILDIKIPGIDGMEVCKRLKENVFTKKIPVMMLTAKGELNARIKSIKLGADDYILKPFDVLDIRERVKTFLRKTNIRNPITNLPSFNLMKDKIMEKIKSGGEIEIARIDFGNLDVYNNAYGMQRENEFLKIAAQVIEHSSSQIKDRMAGHLSDKCFIVICKKGEAHNLSKSITASMDEIIPFIHTKGEKKDKMIKPIVSILNSRKEIEGIVRG